MKRFFFALILIGLLTTVNRAEAQVSVNINIGAQPMWGPVGHDYVRYYYLPEIDVYYDVPRRRYTYYHGNRWVTRASLPSRYRHVDIYRTYKVVLNHDRPWRNHHNVRRQYSRYASHRSQRILRDHREYRRDRFDRKHDKKHKRDNKSKRYHHRGRD
ncbi:hypothetical protein BC792_11047 [Sphingobacterium allocomposti]|jgi:hypothetical protein|uniref:YXWGXW repeat-containing protein n=1 Tax=Sphingobacterium allocomposti TaxID=415956 RepID=A0A5S5DIB3_9SPHI|nr:hypothetical protein [Sphingobacterium composti Yoo et al. 2007 non Ten et al. 2007]TYP95720.1 hypothetical protein BC792_11047 [Sphingobacterium composti Yoo et al. 2007 non Ten et al. 2007]HLS96609.1 hypothetical protein [Sphingobacterium sp.]